MSADSSLQSRLQHTTWKLGDRNSQSTITRFEFCLSHKFYRTRFDQDLQPFWPASSASHLVTVWVKSSLLTTPTRQALEFYSLFLFYSLSTYTSFLLACFWSFQPRIFGPFESTISYFWTELINPRYSVSPFIPFFFTSLSLSLPYFFYVQLTPTIHPPTNHLHSDSPVRQDQKLGSNRGRTLQVSCLHVLGHFQIGTRTTAASQHFTLWDQQGYVVPQPPRSSGGQQLVVFLLHLQAGVSGHQGSSTACLHGCCRLAEGSF